MHVEGYDYGRRQLVRIEMAKTCQAAGSSNKYTLEKLPARIGNCNVHVLGFIVRLPTAAQTIPAGKVLDGASVSQLANNWTLRFASSAPCRAAGITEHFVGLDGYFLHTALAYVSGVFPYLPQSGFPQDFSNTDVAHASSKHVLGYYSDGAKKCGWPNMLGPFGKAASGGTTAWTERPLLYLAVNRRRGADLAEHAVPAHWYSGAQDGCDTGSAGSLEFALSSVMDGTAVTWTVSDGVDILADVLLVPDDTVISPPILRIEQNGNTEKRFSLPRGAHFFTAMVKSLSTDGDESSVNHTIINASVDGVRIFEEEMAVHRYELSLLNAVGGSDSDNGGFAVPTYAAEAKNGNTANQDRYFPPMQPLIMHKGSILLAPGSAVSPIVVDVSSTSETTFKYIDAYYPTESLRVRAAALAVHGRGKPARAEAAAKSGKPVSLAISNMLPQKIKLPK